MSLSTFDLHLYVKSFSSYETKTSKDWIIFSRSIFMQRGEGIYFLWGKCCIADKEDALAKMDWIDNKVEA